MYSGPRVLRGCSVLKLFGANKLFRDAKSGMNSLQVECTQCKRRFAAKPHLAGKRVKCPKCGTPIDIPKPELETGLEVLDSIEVRCNSCLSDFTANAEDVGTDVPCPMCDVLVTVRGGSAETPASGTPASGANPFSTGVNPLNPTRTPGRVSSRNFGVPVQKTRFGATAGSGENPLARSWPSMVVVGVSFVSLVLAMVAGHVLGGMLFLVTGLVIAGIGVAFPPTKKKLRKKQSGKMVGKIASLSGGGLLAIAYFTLRILGRMGRRGQLDNDRAGALAGAIVGVIIVVGVLLGLLVGMIFLIIRFGFFRPTAVAYSLVALALPMLWIAVTPNWSPKTNLPRSAAVKNEPLPTLPDLPASRSLSPGVDFREVRLPVPANQPGGASRIWVYTPPGRHADHSLPCVIIVGAGAFPFTGMELGDGDRPEHLPYVKAGYAVVAYEIDGYLREGDKATDQQYMNALEKYWASKAGMINARNAIEFTLAKVPEIDPARLYTAGHSSAAIQALLLACNDRRIKACVAFAPICDMEVESPDHVRLLRRAISGFDDLLKMASPSASADGLKCPVFLFHALDDSVVSVRQSTDMAARLQGAGKQVKLVTVPRGDHYDPMISTGIPLAIEWLAQFSGVQKPSPSPPSRQTPTPGNLPDLGSVAGNRPRPSQPTMPTNFPRRPSRHPGSGRGMGAGFPTGSAPSAKPANEGDTIDQLIAKLGEDRGFAKRNAIKEIARLDPKSVEPKTRRDEVTKLLNQIVRESDPFSQKEAVRALGTWGNSDSVDRLIEMINDPRSRMVSRDVYAALGQLKDPRAAMAVSRKIADFFDKDAARQCLRSMGPLAEDALIAIAPTNDSEVCMAAVTLLGELGTEKSMATLRTGLRSKNPAVRQASKVAIRSIRLRHPAEKKEPASK